MTRSKELVSYSWKPLSPEANIFPPQTHTHTTSYANIGNLLYIRVQTNPSEAETPIGRSLLNEFFNKLMRSERKQEIEKAKLKKVRQQINVQANPQQVQVGGGAIGTTPAQAMVTPAGPTAVTPPQATVPRKAQVGRPARIPKPKVGSPTAAATVASKKNPPPKPPVTRSKTKNQPTPTPVVATDLEADVTALVDAEYDTDALAELPTDSDSKTVESEQGEDPTQLEGQ